MAEITYFKEPEDVRGPGSDGIAVQLSIMTANGEQVSVEVGLHQDGDNPVEFWYHPTIVSNDCDKEKETRTQLKAVETSILILRCFKCRKFTETNEMENLDEDQHDKIVSAFTLIALDGPEECFDTDGAAIICKACVEEVLR